MQCSQTGDRGHEYAHTKKRICVNSECKGVLTFIHIYITARAMDEVLKRLYTCIHTHMYVTYIQGTPMRCWHVPRSVNRPIASLHAHEPWSYIHAHIQILSVCMQYVNMYVCIHTDMPDMHVYRNSCIHARAQDDCSGLSAHEDRYIYVYVCIYIYIYIYIYICVFICFYI